ncbi:DUF3558 domain-containing protein [Actinosynnema sp. CA-299493]
MNRALARISAASAVAFVMLVTACADQSGTATPASTTTATTATYDSTSSAAPTASALAEVNPCDLLTADEATSLGLTSPGEADRVGGTESCDWQQSGNGGLVVGIRPTSGLGDLTYDTAKGQQINVGKYDAVRIEAPNGAQALCDVLIAVSESSSVQVAGNLKGNSTDTAAACERATRAADLIAPKLP